MLCYLRVCGDSGVPNVEQTVWKINAVQHKNTKQKFLNMLSKKTMKANLEIKQNDA